jgi:arylsulfatase
LQRGFDRYYGTIQGGGSYWDPAALVRDNQFISAWDDREYQPREPFYYTDAISDHAVRFIAEHQQRAADKPFFLYVAYTAAHWPMHAREKEIAKYEGRYAAGYAPVREARLAKAKMLGVIGAQTELSAPVGDWERVKDKKFETRCMEVYAAMIDSMDQGIGRVVGELKKHGQLENTLVLYLQDNGGCAETVGRGVDFKARADQPTLPPLANSEIQHDSPPKQTRDGYPIRQGYGVLPGPADTFVAYGENWANVSNTPFREYKHWVHEGGISTPLIAHWPRGIAADRRNDLVRTPAHLIDIMATCLDLAGAGYPAEYSGEKIQPLEGVSLRPLFEGKTFVRQQPIFFEHEGNRAVREGPWKLVAKGPLGVWELYDIEADRTERNDLAGKLPEKRDELVQKWEAWAKRAQVLPWPWKPEEKPAAGAKRQAAQAQESAQVKAL